MTTTEIKQQLCYYDNRNPDYIETLNERLKSKPCYCDNCYKGNHELANELLRVKELLSQAVEPIR